MRRRSLHIIFYACIGSILLITYHGFTTSIIYTVVRSGPYNKSFIIDELESLQPIEKKTYTPCPNSVVNYDDSSLRKVILTENEIKRIKLNWQNFILTISPYPTNKYSGRGIVSSASSGFQRYSRLIALIKLLRWLKCRLPVEVFMYPGELNTEEITEFEKIPDVTVRVLKDNITGVSKNPNNYAIKPRSILHSSFEHVLWLDSDNIAVRDPEYLFDLPHYTRSTAMFWPDLWSTPGKNPIWKILDIPCRAEDYEQESGQLLINKRLSWKALNLALYFSTDKITSKLIHGDKDFYRLSWKVLETNFYFIRKFLGIGGFYYIRSVNKYQRDEKSKFCGHTMVQHDPLGEILFLHANLVKYYPLIDFSIEETHFLLKNYTNVWRVYHRYANSAPYFRPRLFHADKVMCTTFATHDSKNLPPILEDDFHNHVSANTIAQYLSYLNGSVIRSQVHGKIRVVDRATSVPVPEPSVLREQERILNQRWNRNLYRRPAVLTRSRSTVRPVG